VYFDISISLDGYVAGPNDGPENGLGDGGEALHEWIFGLKSWREPHGREGGAEGPEDELIKRSFAAGAIIIGRRMYQNAGGWGDEPPFKVPVFVLTGNPREKRECDNGTSFTFLSDPAEALHRARDEAGERDVAIGGGARAIRTFIEMGVVGRFGIHVAPLLLGGGVSLFDGLDPDSLGFRPTAVLQGAEVVHIDYEVTAAPE
jgi:dihydrofolate reductase